MISKAIILLATTVAAKRFIRPLSARLTQRLPQGDVVRIWSYTETYAMEANRQKNSGKNGPHCGGIHEREMG